MLAVVGVMSITSGTCLACGSTRTRFERHVDIVSGLLLVAGLSLIGAAVQVGFASV